VVLDAARRNRELFAWALIAFVAASLVVDFLSLFTAAGFARNSAQLQVSFVDPLLTGALVVAVVLASMGEAPTGQARLVVQSALGVMGAMLGLGVVAWLAGLTVDPFFVAGSVKAITSLRFLVAAGLLGVAAWFAWMVLNAVPAPQRRSSQAQQPPGSWGPAEGGWQPGWDRQEEDARPGAAGFGEASFPASPHGGPSFPSPSYGDQPRGGYAEQQPHAGHGRAAQPPAEQRWEGDPTWHSGERSGEHAAERSGEHAAERSGEHAAEQRWPDDPEAQPHHADVLHPDPQADHPTEQMAAVPAPEEDVDATLDADRQADQSPSDTDEGPEWWRPR
jgi:hypothetical protein